MADNSMPHHYWAEAVATVVYIMNRTPTAAMHCIAYVHVLNELRTKLDPKAEKCVFFGYSFEQKGYRCYNPVTRKMRVSRDVMFDEMSSWYADVKDTIGADADEHVVAKNAG